MSKTKKIAYTYLIGDLFHYGHLRLLEEAKNTSDYHICGVISDKVSKSWQSPMICSYKERQAVVDKIEFVDEVMVQDSMDPTENLIKIHNRFPEATIMLFQSHLKWGGLLGTDLIKEFNGEVVRPEYYPGLSRDIISKKFFNAFVGQKKINDHSYKNLIVGDIKLLKKHFSTKANTLKSLRPLLKNASIEKEFIFTVEQWVKNENEIINQIKSSYNAKKIVIRSSSLTEDSFESSSAGLYESQLNVDSEDKEKVRSAINKVINSYKIKNDFSIKNQILVQKQSENVIVSGVVFTRNLGTNTPYYLINYDDTSDKTDTVTGGIANKKIEIMRNSLLDNIPQPWQKLIKAVREIEALLSGLVLDIEFAITKEEKVITFQVRPLSANSRFHTLDDDLIEERILECKKEFSVLLEGNKILTDELFLSDMAFWNPAELIGDRPNYLDYSLFNHLIMKSNWNEALTPLGYTKVDAGLMEFIGQKPYINIHNAFLSLLPEKLPIDLKIKLMNFYNIKLKNRPELHDKIEFEIVHNCYEFTFENKAEELIETGFSNDEVENLRKALIDLTNNILDSFDKFIKNDGDDINELRNKYNIVKEKINLSNKWNKKLDFVYELIEDCKKLGTTQFSRTARFAFIGKALLQSIKEFGIIDEIQFDKFMNSISTVATEMDNDFNMLRSNNLSVDAFFKKYGHLRPGTYNITNLPYNKNQNYINTSQQVKKSYVINLENNILDEKTSGGKERREFILFSSDLLLIKFFQRFIISFFVHEFLLFIMV